MFQSTRFNEILNRILQILVLFYQGIVLTALVIAPFLAFNWLKLPFIGAFTEQTMLFNGVGPGRADPAWGLYQQVKLGDHLLEVDHQLVQNESELQAVLQQHSSGEELPVTYLNTQGETITATVTLNRFPDGDRFNYLFIPYFVGLTYLAISLWIFGFRRSESAGRAFALFASSMAIASAGLFDLYTTHRLTTLWTFAVAFAGGALFDLAMTFPQEVRWVVNRPYLRWLGYLIAVVLTFYALPDLYNSADPAAYITKWRLIYSFTGLAALSFIGISVYRRITSRSPVVQQQARTVLTGAIAGFGPMAIWLLVTAVSPINFIPFLFLFTVIFPATTGYAILRQRMFRTDYLLRQGILYTALTVIAIAGYALLVSGVSLIFGSAVKASNPWLIGTMVFILAASLDPFRNRLQSLIDTTFFRGQSAYAEHIQRFTRELTGALDLESITGSLRQQIVESFGPERVHIYIYDPVTDQYAVAAEGRNQPSSDIRFASASPLAQHLHKEGQPLYLDGIALPAHLQADKTRIALLGAHLFVRLPGSERPNGWLALGARISGQPYTRQDLIFLENLCDQASVAIERVQTVADLQRRVQELNALARVSQGVNVTVSFDDILELIFTQTALVVPTTDLHITLFSEAGNYFYYAFCVENHERLVERENVPIPENQGLGREVVQKSRPILTQDYRRECQVHNVLPGMDNIYAWMGVPLNAGNESIGSLSVGSRDATTTYTSGQLDILQAIADQTAGAIVKARLLQVTQQRAHQLATLNELTRQLTSTLETEPLLKNILENAVSILNCEAGSLFLVDEETDELIFTVTVGPVAHDLLGQRLPAGTGIVGEVVDTQAPVISNNVTSSPDWNADPDEKTGFITRSILAVPLQVKDRVTGVVEVINRRDGLPFVQDDQALLTAFSGQAAVAIENARLYTLTDQELAARVEELSVMQRIDRELNASLEMDRAMRITLEWAMRQSQADAGLIGMLDESNLHIMAQQGYDGTEEEQLAEALNLDHPNLKAAVESGQPQRATLGQAEAAGIGVLPAAHTQVVVPIRREANVIGLLLLESANEAQTDLAFLNRLSDHAAIAIANAQLYGEVQRANVAKSDFVSFVAHELKNPMTSIKGYTELLSGGAVGPINEMQTNFLKTIHSNVERMSTLVTDLNDQSKIEAGRLRIDFKAVNLNDVVEDAVRSTNRQIEEKKQVIETQVAENLPAVWADPTRIGQVLVNLVSNAHKYTPEEGTIIVGVEITDNRWDPEGATTVAHIWVKDDGIGISPEDQRKIFQKFFRSEDQKAREAPGTGLGLNITKSLVEMQGGKIWFESEFRKGTTFHFTVPIAEE